MNKKKIISIIAIIALVAVLGICLVACNADSYGKKLEKAGYTVTTMSEKDFDKEDGDVSWGLIAGKIKGGLDGVTIIKFKKTADAKAFENDIKRDKDDNVYRTGTIVMFGTAQGIKDAK